MPPALVASCVERAEGNPLFLLQLLLNAGARRRSQACPGRSRRSSTPAWTGSRATTRSPCSPPRCSASASRSMRCAICSTTRPTTAGSLVENFLVRARRQRSSCSAMRSSATAPTHRCCTSGGAPLHGARRRVVRSRATSCSPPSTSTAPRIRAPRAAYLAAGNVASRRNSATRRRSRSSSAASLSPPTHEIALRAPHGARPPDARARPRRRRRSRPCRAALDASAGARRAGAGADRQGRRNAPQRPHRRGPGRARRGASRSPTDAALALELSRLHHLRGNLLSSRSAATPTACASTSCAPARPRSAGSLEAEAAALGGLGDGFYLQGRMRVGAPAVPRVRGARPPARLRPPRGREPVDGRMDRRLTWPTIAAPSPCGHEAIELAHAGDRSRVPSCWRASSSPGSRPRDATGATRPSEQVEPALRLVPLAGREALRSASCSGSAR